MNQLKRVIIDYKKLTPEVLKLLVARYPDGYDDDHIINFRNKSGEHIEAVEVASEDTKYLVKISAKLVVTMANFDEADIEEITPDPNALKEMALDSSEEE